MAYDIVDVPSESLLFWFLFSNWWPHFSHKALNFYPFKLFGGQVCRALIFQLLLVKLSNNDRNEQIHHEKGRNENEDYEQHGQEPSLVELWCFVHLPRTVHCGKHNVRPRFKGRHFEKGSH